MPHAQAMPSSGFQALILCGPGVSLNTFTSTPEELPKALIPIANRPMVWYPLDWCYRMGITDIYLVTPPSSTKAIEAALSQNPHLTSLPLPRADIIAPETLLQTDGTAEILRCPDIQTAITGDFMVLPCDLICEIPGESLLEAWMIQQAGLAGVGVSTLDHPKPQISTGGEKGGRRGGLGVWFPTKSDTSTKGEETDFVITTPFDPPTVPPPEGSIRSHISKLVYSTTTDTLRDITEEKKGLPLRHGLIRKHGRIKMLTTHRDAHIYLLPHWVLDMVRLNPTLDSISEDVIGWWAKATWQDGLAEKLHLHSIFSRATTTTAASTTTDTNTPAKDSTNGGHPSLNEDIDLSTLSTTRLSPLHLSSPTTTPTSPPSQLASRVVSPRPTATPTSAPSLPIPTMLAYIHPSPTPLIRRVDTTAHLLALSLHLATLPPLTPSPSPLQTTATTPTPLSHPSKISPTCTIAPHSTITASDTLIASNTIIASKCVIKASVIGAGCTLASGARITRCVLMEGVQVGERAQLTGCVVGRRAVVGREAVLRECEVQEGFGVEEGREGRGEKFMVFEGLEEDVGGMEGDEEEEMGVGGEE